jgi:hypothetical protein
MGIHNGEDTMQHEDMRSLQGFRQVLEFMARAAVTREEVDMERHRAGLAAVVREMEALAARRAGHVGEGQTLTARRRAGRRRIEWDYLAPLRRMTREIIGADATLAEVLRVPPRTQRVEQLLAVARGVVAAVTSKPEFFSQQGFGPAYVAGFTATIAGLQGAVDAGGVVLAQRSGATADLRRLAQRGRYLVSVLDAMVRPALASGSGLEREWRVARRRAAWVSRGRGEEGGEVGPFVPAPEVRAA